MLILEKNGQKNHFLTHFWEISANLHLFGWKNGQILHKKVKKTLLNKFLEDFCRFTFCLGRKGQILLKNGHLNHFWTYIREISADLQLFGTKMSNIREMLVKNTTSGHIFGSFVRFAFFWKEKYAKF